MRTNRHCTDCGSSDGLSTYEDHTYCHSCKRYRNQVTGLLTTAPAFKFKNDKTVKSLPEDFTYEIPEEGLAWLRRANITESLAKAYHIGYSPAWRRVILPSYLDGQLLGWQGRAASTGQQPKYLQAEGQKPLLFASYTAREHPEFVVLVEDTASAIVLGEHLPTIALLGTSLDREGKQVALLSDLSKEYVLWLDGDRAGQAAARKIEARLDNVGLVLATISHPEDPKLVDHSAPNSIARSLKEAYYVKD